MARARGIRTSFALAFEDTYGTAPSSGFWEVAAAEGSNTLGEAIPLLADDLLGTGRDAQDSYPDVSTTDGDMTVPVLAEEFGLWLKLLLGDPTTTGSGSPYTHVFDSGAASLPSAAIEKQMADVSRFEMITGVRADTLSISAQREGLLTASLGLIGQAEAVAGSTAAGTLATLGGARFLQRHTSIERGGSALGNVVGFEMQYSNALDPIPTLRSDGRIEDLDPGKATCTGTITIRFDNGDLATQAANANTAAAFAYKLVHPNGTDTLTVSLPRVFLAKPKYGVSGPAGIEVGFEFNAAEQTNGDPMMTATLVNSTADYNAS